MDELNTSSKHRLILLVDDTPSVLTSVGAVLAREGYDVVAVRSGHEALAMRSAKRFDAIIVDLKMPGMDGLELLRQLKVRHPDDIVMLLGAVHDFGSAVKDSAQELGAHGFLVKPVKVSAFTKTMEHVFAPDADDSDLSELGETESQSGQGYTVLIADDEERVRDEVARGLRSRGYEVVTVADGYEALFYQAQRSFDVLILGVKMSGLTGLGILKQLRQDHRPDVVMMLSGVADPVGSLETEAKRMGADVLLKKPVKLGDLTSTLRQYLQEAAKRKANTIPEKAEGSPDEVDEDADPKADRLVVYPEFGLGEAGGTRGSVLVVDDEQPTREAVAKGLVGKGYHVVSAPNGHEALEFVEREKVDAIILDIRMPEITGIEVLRSLKSQHPDSIVIMLTGIADEDGKISAEATKLGADGFLTKPIRLAELEQTLEEAIQHRASGVVRPVVPEATKEVSKKRTVLVVDNEEWTRTAIATGLGGKGYDVVTALTGDDALEFVGMGKVDAIVLDGSILETGGTEALRSLKTRHPDSIVIMLTGVAEDEGEVSARATELGVDAFLTKPIRLAELEETLDEVIEHRASDVNRPIAPEVTKQVSERRSVLVVDDEESITTAVTMGLSKKGYDVVSAQTGEEALHYQAQEKFDVIILDVNMPEITGLEVLHKLKSMHPDAVVVMLTAVADADKSIETTALELGAHAFLKKPIHLGELDRALQGVLGRAGTSRPVE